jgi:hypothetical protein
MARLYPVPRTFLPPHSRRTLSRRLSIRTLDAGVAFCSQSSVGRHVGCAPATSTNFPLALGSHATNAVLSANRGKMTVVAVRSFLFVPGLNPSIVPSTERTRGAIRSMCE